jgi:hypothetical protein
MVSARSRLRREAALAKEALRHRNGFRFEYRITPTDLLDNLAFSPADFASEV